MELTYNLSDHVSYWAYQGKTPILVTGSIYDLKETGHKSMMYIIKRDHHITSNMGMYELDEVNPMSIVGYVPKDN